MTNIQSSKNPTPNSTNTLTQEVLGEALNKYIAVCHGGRIRKGCGAWYRATQAFAMNGYKGQALDQAMYRWVTEKLEKAAEQPLYTVH